MKYIGNKEKLLSWIDDCINKEQIDLKNKIILDGFLGTGSFSKFALQKGAKKIYGCEILKSMCYYSLYNIFGVSDKSFQKTLSSFLKHNVSEGYFFKNFSTFSGRNYFSDDNSLKIDSMLKEWDNFSDLEKGLSIDIIDRVSNTSGTYGSFLKIWRSMALKNIESYSFKGHFIEFNKEVFEVLNYSVEEFGQKVDISYLDPPYNSRQYGSYYHVLERVVDKKSGITSKTGVLKDDSNSLFSKKTQHKSKIINLIKKLDCKILIISYNNEGIIAYDEWIEILKSYKYNVYTREYKRYKSNNKTSNKTYKNDQLKEFLFFIYK